MDVLDRTVIPDWCRGHGFTLSNDDADPRQPLSLLDDPSLIRRTRVSYAEGQRSGREPAVAAAAVRALGPWDECLVWVTGWGVWPSGEDWPRFYAWRGAHGERRSLEVAPAHVFHAGEEVELERILSEVMENGWDAIVLAVRGGQPSDRRIRVSHDEWIEICSLDLFDFGLAPSRANVAADGGGQPAV